MQKRSRDPKTLASAGEDCKPAFERVVMAATTALICDLSVQIFCLSHDQLSRWQQVFADTGTGNALQDGFQPRIHDLNRATLAEWQTVLARQSADLTVLAGFHSAQHRQEISTAYANALVEAVPSGMVVVA